MKQMLRSAMLAAALGISAAAADFKIVSNSIPLLRDPGFEGVTAGKLSGNGGENGWEVQRTGRDSIKDRLIVTCLEDSATAKSGRKCLSLSIPQDTQGFEFVTVGQRVGLIPGKDYEAVAWVRWADGPRAAPAGADAVSGHPSAIVSFWARHREGTGDFAGRDVWLFDNRWTRLSFRFRATDPGQRTLAYVSLLPNQKPTHTTVLLDDFEVTATDAPAPVEPRTNNLVRDGTFAGQKAGAISPPWYFANLGGKEISGRVVEPGTGKVVTLSMGPATSNLESAQIWQHLELAEGARYEISCRIRWDNFKTEAPAPIVNFGIYHEDSRTWYGPVDQVLQKSAEWKTYRFVHVPPASGSWKLYVQLNGWGNFGNGVTISLDDLSCKLSR